MLLYYSVFITSTKHLEVIAFPSTLMSTEKQDAIKARGFEKQGETVFKCSNQGSILIVILLGLALGTKKARRLCLDSLIEYSSFIGFWLPY